ncbi:MAG: NAD(P)/FAD-dependent oxidoreductase, partial [Bryobacterales bacterium]|nr:NAD(P)/FAD-dependent oxidoreductase [Bryobacterales bacterium]
MGYYIPGNLESVVIRFPGYKATSGFSLGGGVAGICGRTANFGGTCGRRWSSWTNLPSHGVAPRSMLTCCLALRTGARWGGNRLAGDGWLAVGDAGGLVDPITGEGISSIRSGDLAARILADDR